MLLIVIQSDQATLNHLNLDHLIVDIHQVAYIWELLIATTDPKSGFLSFHKDNLHGCGLLAVRDRHKSGTMHATTNIIWA